MDTTKPDPTATTPAPYQPVEIIARGLPPTPLALNSTPDPLSMWKAFRRRWVLALMLGFFLAATIGPAAWYLTPSAKYTAKSTLYVASRPKRIIFEPRDASADSATYQRTQIARMMNRDVLLNVLAKPNVAELQIFKDALPMEPEEWLEKSLKTNFVNGSEVLEVSLSGGYPEEVATIVNEVIKSYMDLVVEEERKDRLDRLAQLDKLWDRYQIELEQQRKKMKETATAVGMHSKEALVVAQQNKSTELHMVVSEQLKTQGELLRLQAAIKTASSAPEIEPQVNPGLAAKNAPANAEYDQEIEQHALIVDAKKQLDILYQKYKQADRLAKKKNDPSLTNLATQWNEGRKQLEELRVKVRDDVHQRRAREIAAGNGTATVSQDPRQRANTLAKLQVEMSSLKDYLGALKDDADRLQTELQNLNVGGVDLVANSEEVTIASEVAHKVKAEAEAVKVELDAPERVRLLAVAKPPKNIDDAMKKVKVGGAAALGSFLLAVLGVSFWEFRARRVDNSDDITNGLGLRLVGALPAMPVRARRGGALSTIADQRWQSLLIESIDATRTLLLHASRTELIRAVMITSAVKGEGKTSLSCHLAASMARSGRRTLLIDGDLRSPSIHRTFDIPIGPGLCELLRGEVQVADVIRETIAPGLDLIPAGQCDTRAVANLAREDLKILLAELKAHYDFILIDSAPLLLVADSLLIGQNVDAVLFSVLRDRSRLPEVHAAHTRLVNLGVKMLGAVVNGIQNEGYGSSYYYSSYSRPVSSETPDA